MAEEAQAKTGQVIEIEYAELQRVVSEALDEIKESIFEGSSAIKADETDAEYVARKVWLEGYRKVAGSTKAA